MPEAAPPADSDQQTAGKTRRIDALRGALVARELESLLVTDPVNVRYLTGFTGDSTFLLVTHQSATLLSDRRYEQQLELECGHLPAMIRGPERLMPQLVAEAVAELGVNQIGVEDHSLTLAQLHGLSEALEQAGLGSDQFVPSSGLVAQLRLIKDAGELQTIRNAIHCAERAFAVLRASLRPSMTELQAAHLMEATIRSFGGEGVGFASIIAAGPAGALPHYHPADLPIGNGQGLLIDWGAQYEGYTSDMTRTLSLGPATKKMQEIYPVVLAAQLAAIDTIRPGVPLKDVDAAARDVICKAGYGEKFGHGLGHGIGLEVHESPRLAGISTGVLEAGMVITIEPGIYLPGELGVRIEDDILVTDDGHEVLCSLPKGLDENVVIL
ncbi:M24 family metallopeptidase [Planctomycetaceae bacterium SH139]